MVFEASSVLYAPVSWNGVATAKVAATHSIPHTCTHSQQTYLTANNYTKLLFLKIVKFVHVKIAGCAASTGSCCTMNKLAAFWDHEKTENKLATDCDSWSISTKNLVTQMHKSTAFSQSYCCVHPSIGFLNNLLCRTHTWHSKKHRRVPIYFHFSTPSSIPKSTIGANAEKNQCRHISYNIQQSWINLRALHTFTVRWATKRFAVHKFRCWNVPSAAAVSALFLWKWIHLRRRLCALHLHSYIMHLSWVI